MFGRHLIRTLTELIDLLREHNGLIREDIQIRTGRAAQTPLARLSSPLPTPPARKPPRTASDVYVETRETLLERQFRAQHPQNPGPTTPEPVFDALPTADSSG